MGKIQLVNNGDSSYIIDDKGKILINDIHDADICERFQTGQYIIRFFTKDNRYSYINEQGLFFDKYSCQDFDMMTDIIPNTIDVLVSTKNGKYGVIYNSSYKANEILDPIYDKIESLRSNRYNDQDVIKITKKGKVRLIHGYAPLKGSEEFDCIFTPIQPLQKFIVEREGKYGAIDAETFDVVIPISFDSVEELCSVNNCNIRKYTEDLYNCEKMISFERVVDESVHMSFYRETSGVVSGRWGGYDDDYRDSRTGNVIIHRPYYTPISDHIPINEYGYFYNLFDARDYDVVIHQISNLYIVVKNGKYGLINDEFTLLINTKFKNIQRVKFRQNKNLALFVVTCEEGQFLYNVENNIQTRLYDSLTWHDKQFLSGFYNNFLMYKERGLSGLISPEGKILVKARFKEYEIPFHKRSDIVSGQAYFCDSFKGHEFGFYIEDEKFFGKIPIEEYDTCIEMGERYNRYYITKRHGKYGLINHNLEKINIPPCDDIMWAQNTMHTIFWSGKSFRLNMPISEKFLIANINNKYHLFVICSLQNSTKTSILIANRDKMNIIEGKTNMYSGDDYPYVHFIRGNQEGYINEFGEIFSSDTYDEISEYKVNYRTYHLLVKEGKVGLANERYVIVLPCVYDKILSVKEKSKVLEDGEEKEVPLRAYKNSRIIDWDTSDNYTVSYGRYAGSYAQDEMGYSDDDIDTIFDGDPDAYWNID